MTGISSSTSSRAVSSPLDRLKNELSTEVDAGTIKSDDKDALSSALDSIDASLKADRTSQSGGSRPDRSELGKKIDDLISQQVDKGTLTSDQAGELQNLFKNARPSKSDASASGASPAPDGPPPSAPPPSSAAPSQSEASTGETSTSASSSTDSTGSSDSAKKLLSDFLASLQTQQAQGQSYGANGASNGSATSSLLLNFQV